MQCEFSYLPEEFTEYNVNHIGDVIVSVLASSAGWCNS